MPFQDYTIASNKEETPSYMCLYGGKSLQGLQYEIGDELTITVLAKVKSKEESDRNSVMPSKRVEFEIKSVNIEEPLKTKLKGEVF